MDEDMTTESTCDVCGETADNYTIDVMHRGCRLSTAFSSATTQISGGMLSIDLGKISLGRMSDEMQEQRITEGVALIRDYLRDVIGMTLDYDADIEHFVRERDAAARSTP